MLNAKNHVANCLILFHQQKKQPKILLRNAREMKYIKVFLKFLSK